jgi:hypothetical protein
VNAYLRQTLPETFVLANVILIERICTIWLFIFLQ